MDQLYSFILSCITFLNPPHNKHCRIRDRFFREQLIKNKKEFLLFIKGIGLLLTQTKHRRNNTNAHNITLEKTT